jgi:hypothetical protein
LATNWQSVAARDYHTVAIQSDGTLWAWGYNYCGQLGDGTMGNKSSPVRVGLATNWQSVAAGGSHTVAIQRDGTLWAWGGNNVGQLGDGDAWHTVPGKIGAPVIMDQPLSFTNVAGAPVIFTISATGSQPLSYQWRKEGVAIPNGTNAILTLPSLGPADAGGYTVVITNAYGSVTSSVAALMVVVPPSIVATGGSFGFSNGVFGFAVAGPAGATFVIEGSTNLTDWAPLQTNSLGAAPVYFTDPDSANRARRFYRGRLRP